MPVTITESRERISDFLAKNGVGVLATVDAGGTPHAATVYLTHDRQLNVYFVTKKETQKNRDLLENPRAAIAIYDAPSQTTVQAEGIVREVTDTAQFERVFSEIENIALNTSASGVPPLARLSAGGYVVYMLSTSAVRMATYTNPDANNAESIFEVASTTAQ